MGRFRGDDAQKLEMNLPMRPCPAAGCRELVLTGRCPKHSADTERDRGSSTERGYDWAWRRLAPLILQRDGGVCKIRTHCDGAIATEVDHIRPVSEYPEGRLDPANLQAACKSCNSAKGARFHF
jgi:5-methylcytosine-specific restriction protein A